MCHSYYKKDLVSEDYKNIFLSRENYLGVGKVDGEEDWNFGVVSRGRKISITSGSKFNHKVLKVDMMIPPFPYCDYLRPRPETKG